MPRRLQGPLWASPPGAEAPLLPPLRGVSEKNPSQPLQRGLPGEGKPLGSMPAGSSPPCRSRTQDPSNWEMPVANQEILIVVSKLKDHIRTVSGMNTSAGVAPVVSEIVRRLCADAIERAKADGRKTLKDRDFVMPGDGGA